MSSTAELVKKLGRIVGIWAHPDDETWCMGGLMAIAAENGQAIACITATRGEMRGQLSPDELGKVREQESAVAFDVLGVNIHHWLDYKDGECKKVPEDEAVEQLSHLLEHGKPDTIITFAPDGLTGHDDHKTVSRWTESAVKKAGLNSQIYHAVATKESYKKYLKQADEKFNIFFNLNQPNLIPQDECDLVLQLQPEIVAKKMAAFRAQPSQYQDMLADNEQNHWLEGFAAIESFKLALT